MPSPLALVDALLEALYDTAEPLVLALDDAQHLAGAKASAELVNHLLRWAPANMRVVIGARVVPPLRLQRLRLDDHLTYLAHSELAFSADETAEAVKASGLELDGDTVASIHEATGGWPAGVRMAILAARHDDRPRNVPVELRRDRALADYLATEVLAALSDEMRDFVLDSCLDELVCPSLIDGIRGTTTAEALLEQCLSDGIFLSRGAAPTDEPWYQWHPLFASHIQRRLATDRPERAVQLHSAAAAWWVPVDAPTAIRHAVAAGDGDTASRIFSEHWLELFLEGRVDAVTDAVRAPPARRRGQRRRAPGPRRSSSCAGGRLDAARAEIAAARTRRGAAAASRTRTGFEERTAIVELFLTGYDQGLGAAVESGEAMLERLARGGRAPDPAVQASLQVFVGMGEARLQTHDELPLEMLRASAATAHDTGLLALELTALAESCIPAIAEGRLTEVHDLAVDVLARAADRGWVGLVTLAPAVAYLGWLDYWRGNLTQARAQLERSLSMVLPFDLELRGLTLNFHAKTCLALGDTKAARASMSEIRAMIRLRIPRSRGGPPCSTAWRGWPSWPRAGSAKPSPSHPRPRWRPTTASRRLTVRRVLLLAGDPEAALAEISRVPMGGAFVHLTCLAPVHRGRGPVQARASRRPRLARARARGGRARPALRAVPRRRQDDGRAAQGAPASRDQPPRCADAGARAPLEAARAPRARVG